MGASFWNCIRDTCQERWQRLHGELKVCRVTSGEEETGSFIIDRIIDSSICDIFQGLQILSQSFKANTLHPLRKRQLPQNTEPAHSSVSARAGRAGCLSHLGLRFCCWKRPEWMEDLSNMAKLAECQGSYLASGSRVMTREAAN